MYRVEFNDDEVSRALAALADALSDMSLPMDEIGQMLVLTTKDRMTAGISPDGSPFAPRSPVTIARYEKSGEKYGPQPLWRTRTMQSNIAHRSGRDFAEVGSNAIQAAVMHFGAAQGEFGAVMGRTRPSEKRPKSQDYFMPLPWGNIPARPFLGLSETDRDNIIEIVGEWLEGVGSKPTLD